MSEIKYVTVTALTKYIKRKFDVDPHLSDIWIKGEISNFNLHSRGHMYFTLKDEKARIQGVMFAGANKSLKFKPENGMKVLLRGEISVYEQSGGYQVYVKEMQPDGIGSLYLAYEELKKNLQKEGLFDSIHKKPIPKYPNQIGVITSPTGAAIRDILTTINRRFPMAKVILIPALVQGVQAGASVAKAIKTANALETLDVLIVGRGGGSIEELWAFNEEIVAREIFASQVPIISAVGHETDFTIADFVADLRAPTPTGAAELAVPHFNELLDRISDRKNRLKRSIQEKITSNRDKLSHYQGSYAFRYPKQLYQQKEQQLDTIVDRLQKEGRRAITHKKDSYVALKNRLGNEHPSDQVKRANEAYMSLLKKLNREMSSVLTHKTSQFKATIDKLNALSPLKIMDRGYSIVYQEKQLIKSINQVQSGQMLKVQLKDGQLDCQVKGIEERTINE
ncbi:exodeoxyribonuclease VII large subunit [Metabacillus crassostreae]|uniref:exodeoxyribonuclease VII large subunit n=1 Tax=Metabacillus crassostreae TaxID=929098 RepID=UPI00195BB079|nr:exodeoxyribonuclease VII large subunit [Metabacillus crassostreae]MBM7604588.1 exodeoxyribonuclease VII large subunit [Metabacillus crassostreae]